MSASEFNELWLYRHNNMHLKHGIRSPVAHAIFSFAALFQPVQVSADGGGVFSGVGSSGGGLLPALMRAAAIRTIARTINPTIKYLKYGGRKTDGGGGVPPNSIM